MCILFCYLHDENIDTGYELILLSNRDEDFRRPALQAHVWKDTRYAIGGQDQTPSRAGGTWLSLNPVQCKIGVLLNLTSQLFQDKKINGQSRGFIVSNYVNNPDSCLDEYINELQKNKTNYTGFNFLGLERQPTDLKKWRAKYINNISSETVPIDIDTSVFGFSNHIYGDQHAFKKTLLGCDLLKKCMNNLTNSYTKIIDDESVLIRGLFSVLNDSTSFDDDFNLKNVYSHYTSVCRNQISSIHVPTSEEEPNYATRTSTVILVRNDQTGLFIERTRTDPMNNPYEWSERTLSFKLNDVSEPPILIK